MRLHVLLITLVACDGGLAPTLDAAVPEPDAMVILADASRDAARPADAAVPDATPPDAHEPFCGQPLASTEASGAVLAGEADFISRDGRVRREKVEVQVYFPRGRRPGEPVHLAMPCFYGRRGLAWTEPFILDDAGGVPASAGMRIQDELSTQFTGALLGPDQGLYGQGSKNFAFGTDVGDLGVAATLQLCPAAALPEPRLVATDGVVAPTLPLFFAPSAPFDPAQLTALRVRAGDRDIPVQAALILAHRQSPGRGVEIKPVKAFPPNLPLTVDLAGMTDLLGRAFSEAKAAPPLVTRAVVTDLGFATPPPDGALVLLGALPPSGPVLDGKLQLGSATSDLSDTVALLALGDPGPRVRARIRVGVICPVGSLFSSAALVAAQGEVSVIPIACGAAQDLLVPVPAAGPLWLSVVIAPPPHHPQSYLPGWRANLVEVDEIAFE